MALRNLPSLLILFVVLLAASRYQFEGRPQAPSDGDTVVQRFRTAQEDMRVGHFQAAIDEFKAVLRADPSLVEARVNLGLAYHATGEYKLAVAELSRAAEQRPDFLQASLFLGFSYLKLGLPASAIPALDHALALDPSNRDARRALATAELAQGNYSEATREFRKLFATNSDKADAWFTLGRDYLQMAKRLTSELSLQFPHSVWSLRLAGDVLAERQLWNDAAAAYRKAIAADPAQPGVRAALSDVLLHAGKAQEAESEAKAEPHGADAHKTQATESKGGHDHGAASAWSLESQKQVSGAEAVRLGKAHLAAGQDETASDAFAVAFSLEHAYPEAMYWLSTSYLRLADACFDQLTSDYPDSWRAHELKGEALEIRQADREAIAEFRIAARLNPDDAEIHEALGDLLLRQDELAEGKTELETALRLNPLATRSLYLLGNLYVTRREPSEGIPYLEAALRYDPSLTEARPVLGKAYLKVGKPDLAITQLEQSSAIDRYGNLHYLLYEAYRDEGKPELAAQALAQSQELRRKSAADDQAKIQPLGQE
jgi:tetratricopeptide (TPR) repeat protein